MTYAQTKIKILFVNTGSSATSILAAAMANRIGAGRLKAYAATARPVELTDRVALTALQVHGARTLAPRSKSVRDFTRPGAPIMDCIISLDPRPTSRPKPAWPGRPAFLHWPMLDPGKLRDTDIGKLAAFYLACELIALRADAVLRLVQCEDIFSIARDHTPEAEAVERSLKILMQASQCDARTLRELNALATFAQKRDSQDQMTAVDKLRRGATTPERARREMREISVRRKLAADMAITDRLLCGVTIPFAVQRKDSRRGKRRAAGRPKPRS